MNWINTEDQIPLPGMQIIAELNDCKVMDYCRMTIRTGEGLGHIKRWIPYTTDCDSHAPWIYPLDMPLLRK